MTTPTFGPPPPPTQAPSLPPPSPTKQGVNGIGVAALVVGALALATGFVALLGGIIFLASQPPVPPQAVDDTVFLPEAPASATGSVALKTIETPCYSFDGPAGYISDIPPASVEGCATKLHLWGELQEDGTILNTGFGAIWGTVFVEPIRVSVSETWSSDGTIDGVVDYLNTEFFPGGGKVQTLRNPIALDGSEANLTLVDSDSQVTVTKAHIVSYAPQAYPTESGDVQLFVISIVVPDHTGDELIEAMLETWRWK